jgi:CheY-like chemotaxis protein
MNVITKKQPSVAILDIVLLDISTLEIKRDMRSDPTLALIPEVVVPAKSPPIEISPGREAGASANFTKPIDQLEMNKAAEKVLSG